MRLAVLDGARQLMRLNKHALRCDILTLSKEVDTVERFSYGNGHFE